MLKQKNGKRSAKLSLVLTGVAVSVAALLLCAFLASIIAYSSGDPTAIMPALSLSALILAGVIPSAVTTRFCGPAWAIVSAAVTVALILILALILSGGRIPSATLMNCGCYLGSSALTAALARKRPRRTRHPKRK